MPYKFLEEIGTADIAFEAVGRDLPELFRDAADATMNVMIDNLDAIEPRETRNIELSNEKIDMLLFDFLQELIYFKDAERLLLRTREVRIDERDQKWFLKAEAAGVPLDAAQNLFVRLQSFANSHRVLRIFHRLFIYFLDHVTFAQASFCGWRIGVNFGDHGAFDIL